MTTTRRLSPAFAGLAILAIGLSACGGTAVSGGVSVHPSAPAASQPAEGPTASGGPGGPGAIDPAPPVSDPGGGAGVGGNPGDPGSGVGGQPVPNPVDPGQAKIVTPLPGRLNPHPVVPIDIRTSIDGRHVLVKLTWYSGVEPCSVLDSVKVERSGTDIALTPIEGASNLAVACIDIAMLKATIVDLGDLEPGTYRISSPGSETPAVQITID